MTARRRHELVRFLLELCEIDPLALVQPDQLGASLTLASKLLAFGMGQVFLDHPKEQLHQQALAARIREEPERWLSPLIGKVKLLLDAVADGETFQAPIPTGSHLVFDGSALKVSEPLGFAGGLAWRIGGSGASLFTCRLSTATVKPHALAAVFLFTAIRQLDSEQGVMVRRCAREICRRVFLATRNKQRYCTRKCSMAVSLKRHVERQGIENYRVYHAEVAKKSYHNRKEGK